jgi:hypothetical protein
VLIVAVFVPPFLENLTDNAPLREPPVEIDAGPQESSYVMGKVFFFGVIVAAVGLYLRANKTRQSRDGGILGA